MYNEDVNQNSKKEKGAIFMKIKITGKELKITEAINDYVEKKLDRIDKYFDDAEADVTLKTEKNAQIAEICVIANSEKFRAVTEDKDLYASIDKDIDILEGQIRKFKTKKEKMMNFLYVRKNIYFPFILSICFNSSIVRICFLSLWIIQ